VKRAIVADIHLSGYKDDAIQGDGLPLRLSGIIKVLHNICVFCEKNDITHVDVAGDLNNDKDIIYTDAQNAFVYILTLFPKLHFTLISGNHDMSSSGEYQTSSIQALSGYPNVHCIFKPTIIDNITFIPFGKDMIKNVDNADSNSILISHFGLNEAQLQSGISIVSDIKINQLLKFNLVLLGHYHKPQELYKNDTRLFYIGNPVHFNWNDKNEKKRFLVYDTKTLEVKSFNLSGFVEYREFIVDDNTKDIKSILDEAVKLKNEGHHVRVRKLTDTKIQTDPIHDDLIIVNENTKKHQERGIKMTMSQNEIYKKYLTYKQIQNNEHEEYLKVLDEVLN
jgi:DNA repair exonuclease SbcCD nuclease subunit